MADPRDLVGRPPFGRISPRARLQLDVWQLSPVIHIAHRRTGGLKIPERIVFDHELVLFLKGRGRFLIDGDAHEFSPHTLFFLPPFIVNSIEPSTATVEHVAVHFDFESTMSAKPSRRKPYEIQLSHGLSIPTRIDLQPSDGIEEACLDVVRAFAAIDPMAEVEASAILSRLLIQLLRLRPEPVAGDGQGRIRVLIDKAIRSIESDIARRFTAEDLASEVGLSTSHFNRVFRQQTGYAPMEYLRRHRVKKAKELLGDVDLSVKEIARRTGFDDAYHFSRVFRQIAGVPPTGYRDALLSRPGK